MPRPGIKLVTVKEETFRKAEGAAKKVGLSISRYVTNLIEQAEANPV